MERSYTADIAPGSQWAGKDGTKVRVLSTTSTHVQFDGPAGVRLLHHWHFREHYSSPYDARKVRSQFSMSLAVLATFHAFWSPGLRKMLARSDSRRPQECYRAARGSPALPPDAVYVNTYASPAHPSNFEEDLNDVLACIDHRAAA